MVTPPRNILDLYIDARVDNPPYQGVHESFNGFFLSISTTNNDEDRMSYLGIDIGEVGPDPLIYCGGNTSEQHFDAPC